MSPLKFYLKFVRTAVQDAAREFCTTARSVWNCYDRSM